MPYDLIIFDCDGTITDTEYINNKATIDALAKHGVTAYSLEYAFQHFIGLTMSEIRRIVEVEQGVVLSDAFIDDFIALASATKDEFLQPVPGAVDAVRELTACYKSCVASNGERSMVFESLHHVGLFDLFGEDKIFTKIQVPLGKPAPDLFLFAARQMGAEPSRCLVIEDSVAGVAAGITAGMTVFGFTGAAHDSASSRDALQAAGAHQVMGTWAEIINVINARAQPEALALS